MQVAMTRRETLVAAVLLVVGTAPSADANRPIGSDTANSRIEDTSVVTTPLSSLERARAEAWGLSETEWRRYRRLQEVLVGSIRVVRVSIHNRDYGLRRLA